MLDVSVSYNRYRFLGDEFLTWIWFLVDTDVEKLRQIDPDMHALEIGNRIVLENRVGENVESITIKGDDADLEEGRLALAKGAKVTEINLVYSSGDHRWQFNIKGESMSLTGLKVPQTGPVQSREDVEGAILEKIYLYEKGIQTVDRMFDAFIRLRISETWNSSVIEAIEKWIKNEK